MKRLLKELQHLVELLQDDTQVMRFHSLKTHAQVVPWFLQLTIRDDSVWRILDDLTQNTVWSLLGVSLKTHTQSLSKPAQILNQLTTPGKGHSQGKGMGKNNLKGKTAKRQ